MKKRYIILLIILLLLGGGAWYISTFKLDNIQVAGCVRSSEDPVKEVIREEAPMGNILLLWLKNKLSPIQDIPFVAKLDIEFIDKNTLSATVYEKSVAGCLEYMDSYVYFDRDGIVLESTEDRKEGVPTIDGLNISSWVLNEELPVSDKERFDQILTITQLVEKYGLKIDRIAFTKEGEIILRHEKIEIELGDGTHLNQQMMNLGSILMGLKGKKGTLYMKDFDSDTATASFKEK